MRKLEVQKGRLFFFQHQKGKDRASRSTGATQNLSNGSDKGWLHIVFPMGSSGWPDSRPALLTSITKAHRSMICAPPIPRKQIAYALFAGTWGRQHSRKLTASKVDSFESHNVSVQVQQTKYTVVLPVQVSVGNEVHFGSNWLRHDG